MTITINAYKHNNQRDIVIKVSGFKPSCRLEHVDIQRGGRRLLHTGWSEQQTEWLPIKQMGQVAGLGDTFFVLERELASWIDPGPITVILVLDNGQNKRVSYFWPSHFVTLSSDLSLDNKSAEDKHKNREMEERQRREENERKNREAEERQRREENERKNREAEERQRREEDERKNREADERRRGEDAMHLREEESKKRKNEKTKKKKKTLFILLVVLAIAAIAAAIFLFFTQQKASQSASVPELEPAPILKPEPKPVVIPPKIDIILPTSTQAGRLDIVALVQRQSVAQSAQIEVVRCFIAGATENIDPAASNNEVVYYRQLMPDKDDFRCNMMLNGKLINVDFLIRD